MNNLHRREFVFAVVVTGVIMAAVEVPVQHTGTRLGGVAGKSGDANGPAREPNIVFILVDNVGWGDFSCYSGSTPTPRIDKPHPAVHRRVPKKASPSTQTSNRARSSTVMGNEPPNRHDSGRRWLVTTATGAASSIC